MFGLHRDTARKMLAYSVPLGYYRRQTPPRRPKPSTSSGGTLHRSNRPDSGRRPEAYEEAAPHGQAHPLTNQGRVRVRRRIHHRQSLRQRESPPDRDDVRAFVPFTGPCPVRLRRGFGDHRRGGAEGPLLHPASAAQRGCFVKAYPADTTEAFLDGHVSAFALLGGVPQSVLYDNTRLAVAKILGDGRRQRTRAFTEL